MSDPRIDPPSPEEHAQELERLAKFWGQAFRTKAACEAGAAAIRREEARKDKQ